MKICTRCVLPETFPGISFNSGGVCNYCLERDGAPDTESPTAYRERFQELIDEYRGTGDYDVLMCYSGGKDSTYTLAILRVEYGLRVLAVSVDNGFLSPQAVKNIRVVVERLGTDHVFFKPRYDIMAKIFRRCAGEDIFPPKALEKASSICTACMGIVKYSTLRMALEKNIPFIAYGWSPGQAPVTSSVIETGPRMVRLMQRPVFEALYGVAGDDVRAYFPEQKHFEGGYRFPYLVHPLAFTRYDEAEIFRDIARLGWEPPADVDPDSTNCLLNAFANLVHKQRLGFHPYAYELANLVRDGYLDRQTAIDRLAQPEDPQVLAMVRARLGL